MALVGIACLADATLELNAGPLLHDVRGLMGSGVQVRGAAEHDVTAVSIRRRPHSCVRFSGCAVLVRADRAHIVATERPLDPVAERRWSAVPQRASRRSLVNRRADAALLVLDHGIGRIARRLRRAFVLHGRAAGLLDQRALARLWMDHVGSA